MIPVSEKIVGEVDGNVHPALFSFLYQMSSRLPDTEIAGSENAVAVQGDADNQPRRPAPANDRAEPLRLRYVLLVCPVSPFSMMVAEVLRAIDAQCEIRRVTVAAMRTLPRSDEASLILIDLDAVLIEGEALIRDLSTVPGRRPVVAISSNLSESSIDRALNAGALAYLPKNYTHPLIDCVLRLALNGETYRPWRTSSAIGPTQPADSGREAEAACGLTPRERQVLGEIAQGCTNLEIAKRLRMSEATVKTHTHKIFRKLNVQNRAEAALRGARLSEIQKLQIDEAECGRLNLSWLQPEMTHSRMLRNQWIFRRGDVGSELYYLQRGRVLLPEIDVTLGPGDVFGEVGIFTAERKRTCSACCATEVDLFSLSSEKARRIYFANPQFALFILTLVATRLMAERAPTRRS
jgi:two-component system, NarL family, nitrate/nitrite response regulator NarL